MIPNGSLTREEDIYADEIDLTSILRILWKRRKIIVGFVGLFVLISLLYVFITPPTYRQSAMVEIPKPSMVGPLASQGEVVGIVDRLQHKIKHRMWGPLSRDLGLPKEKLIGLKKISATADRKSKLLVHFTVEGRNSEVLQDVLIKIVAYTNKMIKKGFEPYVKLLKDSEKSIKNSLTLSKSISRLITSRISKREIRVLGFNPTEIYKNIASMSEDLARIEAQLKALSMGVRIVDCDPFPLCSSKSRKTMIVVVSLFLSLILGTIMAFLVEWLSGIKISDDEEEKC